MSLTRKLRRFAPWLVSLFVLAQFAAVVPLLITDLRHDIETESDIADDLAATGTLNHVHSHHRDQSGPQHDHAGLDVSDQCCTIHHHLAGVLPFAISNTPDEFPAIPPGDLYSHRPRGTDPGGMERPPKLPVSV
jgi:hypothetical protein